VQVASILQYLNGRLDLLTLTFLVSVKELGYYAAGAALGQLALLVSSASFIRGITGQTDAVDRAGISIAAVIAGLVVVAAPVAVPLVFGVSFGAAIPIARILAIGTVANYALQGACGRLLNKRRPRSVALCQGVGVVAFAGGIAAFPTLQGVAWSSVISFIVSLVVAHLTLRLASRPKADGP
jgi:O-antigen/teichoic acid export membrane protein